MHSSPSLHPPASFLDPRVPRPTGPLPIGEESAVQDEAWEVATEGGYILTAHVHQLPQLPQLPGATPRATVVLHGATAVPQRFYTRYARYLAARGVRVVTYDYRGVAESRVGSARSVKATMIDWMELDAAAIMRAVENRFRPHRLLAIGHSFGGQIASIVPGGRPPERLLMVAAGRGWLEGTHMPFRGNVLARVVTPVLTSMLGYLPGAIAFDQDLPAGVARQWMDWCTHPDYFLRTHPELRASLAGYEGEICCLSFTDDPIATKTNVRWLADLLEGASVHRRHVSPATIRMREIGHLGAFREASREALWPAMTDALLGDAAIFRALPSSA